jgi:type 2A phosphatase activator TIP41
MVQLSNFSPVKEHVYKNWKITASKGRIANAQELENLGKTHLKQYPDMLFLQNTLTLEHLNGFKLSFNANDALDYIIQDTDNVLNVMCAEEWQKSNVGYVKKEYDWTFTCSYEGTINKTRLKEPITGIDYEKLSLPEPILFYDEIILFEDELSDNGSSILTVKIRSMESGFFILKRFYLRVDSVIYRIFDTRYYHEFGLDYLQKETVHKEISHSDLLKVREDCCLIYVDGWLHP